MACSSAAQVDAGTAYLLRWLGEPAFDDVRSVLDLGCGYGPVGISLARFHPERRVLAVDRDALAVEYSRRNAQLNGVADRVTVGASLGFDHVPAGEQFDLVASNVPAKVGPAALEHLLFGAHALLSAAGRVAVVVIDRLRDQVEHLLADDAGLLERHDNRGYGVFVFRPHRPPSVDGDVYARADPREFRFRDHQWTATPTYTLREFDTFSYSTDLAMGLVEGLERPERFVVVDVGHGHLAAVAAAAHPGTAIELVDRDLLALEVAGRAVPTASTRHTAELDPGFRAGDTVLLRLDEHDGAATHAAAVEAARQGGAVVAYGRTTDIARATKGRGHRASPSRPRRGGPQEAVTRWYSRPRRNST